MTYIDKYRHIWYIFCMKLSQYAKKAGVSYRTAFRWWKAGQLKGYQTASKTIIITEEDSSPVVGPMMVAIYARVSSAEHRANLDRQAERLLDYCAARGYQVGKVVKEVASGVNDSRPQFLALLDDQRVRTIVVEHKDRATRFGFGYVERLLLAQGRSIEVVNLAENDREDLLADLTSILYRFTARLYGQRRAWRKMERIVKQLQTEQGEGS
jgi:putative resolvase